MGSIDKSTAVPVADQKQDNTGSGPKAAPPAGVNWSYWAEMPGWRMREAAALLLAIEPDSMESLNEKDDIRAQYRNLVRRLLRALQMGKINSPVEPQEFLEWAKSNRLVVPSPLEEAIAEAMAEGRKLRDWRALAVKRAKKLKAAKAQLAQYGVDIPPKSLKSLLVMILVMAEVKYRFGVPGNSAALNIENDVRQSGLELTKQTIGSWLDDAKETLRG